MSFGSGAMTNSIGEIKDCDFLLVIGSNTTEAHPIIAIEMAKAVRRGATLVVADPRRIKLADLANKFLPLKSGANIPLINALIYTIINEQLYNQEFVNTRTENFAELKAAVVNFAPEAVESFTGVSAEDIREVARGYAQAKNAGIFYTMGITQHTSGTNNVLSIANLAMLCGHLGKPNSGVNPLRGQNNVQGACDMGALPGVFSGYQSVADPTINTKFSQAWGGELPGKPGLTVGEMLDGAASGSVKGIFILGENPMRSDPDIHHVEHALKQLDFLVVQDIFLTETALLANVVLPGASYAEKDGTFSNTERRVQRVRQAIQPIGNSRPDWVIIQDICNGMGYEMCYSSPEDIFLEIASLTPSYAGINYQRLEQSGIQWPCPAADHPGTKYLHEGKFTRGLGKFHSIDFTPPDELPDAEYPLVLNTGRRLTHYHTGTMTRRSKGLDEMMSEDYLEVNPVDASKLGINDGDQVKIASRRGEVIMKAKVTEVVRPGSVFSSFHFTETAINYLTNSARDPIAKIPELKVCAVKVEKVS
jgi:formate dehydrogenase alpha subunit